MATLSASRRNSANSNPNTPRQSLSGIGVMTSPRMSSVSEKENVEIVNCDSNSSVNKNLNKSTEEEENTVHENEENADSHAPLKALKDIKNENNKAYRSRACSERSDSGISDCSSHITSSSCTSTPLLGKKFRINEETESCDNTSTLTLVLNTRNNLSLERRQSHDSEADKTSEGDKSSEDGKINEDETDKIKKDNQVTNNLSISHKRLSLDKDIEGKPPLSISVSEKIGTFNGSKPTKCK